MEDRLRSLVEYCKRASYTQLANKFVLVLVTVSEPSFKSQSLTDRVAIIDRDLFPLLNSGCDSDDADVKLMSLDLIQSLTVEGYVYAPLQGPAADSLLSRVIALLAKMSKGKIGPDVNVHSQLLLRVIKILSLCVTTASCNCSGKTLMAIIKLLYKMSIVYKLQIVCETSKITLMYILGLLFDSQEKKAQEDANSIFKYLCKMSNAEFLETPDFHSSNFKLKVFALELIVSILQDSQKAIKLHHNASVSMMIKKYLFLSLTQNIVLPVQDVIEVSLQIFFIMIKHFSLSLKDEIEVLFSLFFRILEPSQPSHDEMRHIVLTTLLRIVADPDVVVSLYINYDCDPSSEDIFSKMMQLLSLYINGVPPSEDSDEKVPTLMSESLRYAALNVVVVFARGMGDWAHDVHGLGDTKELKNDALINNDLASGRSPEWEKKMKEVFLARCTRLTQEAAAVFNESKLALSSSDPTKQQKAERNFHQWPERAKNLEFYQPIFHHAYTVLAKSFATELDLKGDRERPASERPEESERRRILAVKGIKHCVHFCCLFDLEVERRAFIESLTQFILQLIDWNNMHNFSKQYTDYLCDLEEICQVDANYLRDDWRKILVVFSEMGYLYTTVHTGQIPQDADKRNINANRKDSSATVNEKGTDPEHGQERTTDAPIKPTSPNAPRTHQNTEQKLRAAMTNIYAGTAKTMKDGLAMGVDALRGNQRNEMNHARLMNSIQLTCSFPEDNIDKVFYKSVDLTQNSALDLVEALIYVSQIELKQARISMFCLQKLAMVGKVNMHKRPMGEWLHIWNLLSAHYTQCGSHQDHEVCMIAVNSLRQLSLQFMECPEEGNNDHQHVIFSPFAHLLNESQSSETLKEFIIECLSSIAQGCASILRSGWRVILKALAGQASPPLSKKLAQTAFACISRLKSRSEALFQTNTTLYYEFQEALLGFSIIGNADLALAESAIKELVEFKSLIVSAFAGKKKRTLDLSKDSQQAQPVVTTFDPLMMIYTMLNGFLLILRKSSSLPHKKLAVGEIFELLMQFSSELDQDAWIMIFNKFLGLPNQSQGAKVYGTTFTVFTYLLLTCAEHSVEKPSQKVQEEEKQWFLNTTYWALDALLKLSFEKLTKDQLHQFLPRIIQLQLYYLLSKNESICHFGLSSIESLLSRNRSGHFDGSVCEKVQEMLCFYFSYLFLQATKSLAVHEEIKRSNINIVETFRYFSQKKQKFIQGKPEPKPTEYQGGEVKKIHYLGESPAKSATSSSSSSSNATSNNTNASSSTSGPNSSTNSASNSGNFSQLLAESTEDHHSRLPHSVKVRFESNDQGTPKGAEKRSHETPTKQQQPHGDADVSDGQSKPQQKYGGRLRRNTLIQFNYLAHENLFNYTHESHLIHEKIRSFFETYIVTYVNNVMKENSTADKIDATDFLHLLNLFYRFLVEHESFYQSKEHYLIEAEIVIGYLDVLYFLYRLDETNDVYMETIISIYLERISNFNENDLYLNTLQDGKSRVLNYILKMLISKHADMLFTNMQVIYPLLCNLMLCSKIEIKMNLSELFQTIMLKNDDPQMKISHLDESKLRQKARYAKSLSAYNQTLYCALKDCMEQNKFLLNQIKTMEKDATKLQEQKDVLTLKYTSLEAKYRRKFQDLDTVEDEAT